MRAPRIMRLTGWSIRSITAPGGDHAGARMAAPPSGSGRLPVAGRAGLLPAFHPALRPGDVPHERSPEQAPRGCGCRSPVSGDPASGTGEHRGHPLAS
jgi:hypothetical protein